MVPPSPAHRKCSSFLPDVPAEPPDLDGPERPRDGGPVLPRGLPLLGRHVAARAARPPAGPGKLGGKVLWWDWVLRLEIWDYVARWDWDWDLSDGLGNSEIGLEIWHWDY